MDGQQLKLILNLINFEYVYIQKIIGHAIKIYVISVNSRYPSKFIPYDHLKHTNVSELFVVTKYDVKSAKLTPPIELDMFQGSISSKSIILIRDLSGDVFIDKSLYENKIYNLNELNEAIKKINVIRNGKKIKKVISTVPNKKISYIGDKPVEVTMTGTEKRKRQIAAKKGAKRRKSKQSLTTKKQQRSLKKRTW